MGGKLTFVAAAWAPQVVQERPPGIHDAIQYCGRKQSDSSIDLRNFDWND
jgi:hypothetical protein